jgi:hypothetical protein
MLAQDNIIIDFLAKSYLQQMITEKIPVKPIVLDEGLYCTLNGLKMARYTTEGLYSQIWGARTKKYWKQKWGWQKEVMETLDWKTMGHVYSNLLLSERRKLVKLASGHLSVGRKLTQWRMAEHSKCPRCQQPEENAQHVLLCQNRQARQVWDEGIKDIRDWMTKQETDPVLSETFWEQINAWHNNTATEHPMTDYSERIINEQSKIGWFGMCMGFLSKKWREQQERHYRTNHLPMPRYTGDRWSRQLITKLIKHSINMWHHRNTIKHGPEGMEQQEITKRLNANIQTQFTIGTNGMRDSDKHLLEQKTPAHIIRNYTRSQKKQWIEQIEQARERAQRPVRSAQAKEQFLHCRRFMENWLKIHS